MNALTSAGKTVTVSDKSVAERATLRIMTARRRRVWRNFSLVTLVTVAMVVLTLAQRDTQDIRSCRQYLDLAVVEFRRAHAEARWMSTFPRLGAGPERRARHYYYNVRYRHQLKIFRPVAVASCAGLHKLFMRPNGRHVVLCNGEDFEVRWMEEQEFRQRAVAVGLGDRIER